MKFVNLIVPVALLAFPVTGLADVHAIKGSDTLAGVLLNAISESDMANEISYLGGGSGKGEKALVAAEQGFAPMSRPMKAEVIAEARLAGMEPVAHVIGLDGIGVFINHTNVLASLTIEQVKKIYTCELTDWTQLSGSGIVGSIKVYRRDDLSGTTDTFKSLVGIEAFGACVTILPETADIAYETASQANAVGYSGLSAQREGNRSLALAKTITDSAFLPTVANIRTGVYPLARKLYVYEATGSRVPNAIEAELLGYLLDRSFLDPILQANGFFTLD